MSVWIIEPHHSVIFRDGRPFGSNPGARAASLDFPFPSTIAGGARTRSGLNAQGQFSANPDVVRAIGIRGPLLVELAADGTVETLMVPAPGDALLLQSDPKNTEQGALKRLAPLALPAGARSDLPAPLHPVGMPVHDPHKPSRGAPRHWFWSQFEERLLDPRDDDVTLADLGHDGPTRETRMHVALSPETGTGLDGALFQTQGIEFSRQRNAGAIASRRLGMAIEVASAALTRGVAALGGERRLVSWREASGSLLCKDGEQIKKSFLQQRACRVILLTPALLETGWEPRWLRHADVLALQAEIVGAIVGRPHVVSGWDFVARRPKASRRLAPAGSVFFLRFGDDVPESALGQWFDAVWLQNVSDAGQDRLDGFGLAAVGRWDGQPQPMNVRYSHAS